MGAGDHQGPAALQEKARQRLGHGNPLDPQALGFLRLDIAPRNRIADDDEVWPWLEARGIEAHFRHYSGRGKQSTHRRIQRTIAATHAVAFFLQKARERGHTGATDRDAVDVEGRERHG